MTTSSLLSVCSGELSEHDLQVLKDYALDAPWEWRKALESLIDCAKDTSDAEAIQYELDDVRAFVRDAKEDIEMVLERIGEPGMVLDTNELLKARLEIGERLQKLALEIAEAE